MEFEVYEDNKHHREVAAASDDDAKPPAQNNNSSVPDFYSLCLLTMNLIGINDDGNFVRRLTVNEDIADSEAEILLEDVVFCLVFVHIVCLRQRCRIREYVCN